MNDRHSPGAADQDAEELASVSSDEAAKPQEKCQSCLYYLSLSCVAKRKPDRCDDIFSPRAFESR